MIKIKKIYKTLIPIKFQNFIRFRIKLPIIRKLYPPKLPEIPIDLLSIPLEHESIDIPFGSDLCRIEDIHHPEYRSICKNIFKIPANYQRKQWEWIYIYQRLLEFNVLKPHKKGIGFGVGKEPLAAIFATYGCNILATDAPSENNEEWIKTGQHATNIKSLQNPKIIKNIEFNKLCKFKTLDMNNHQEIPHGYDFHWSSCVIEHLGSLELIKNFLIESSKKLSQGGVAVHTTEFNLSSNEITHDKPECYVFRRKDLDELSMQLENHGLKMKNIIYNVGSHPYNYYVDIPDSQGNANDLHLRNLIGEFVCTSLGIIITK